MKNESGNVANAVQTAPAATETKKARKPRKAKLTIENAGKACSIRPEVTQDVVTHALIFFAANFNASGTADQVKRARALKIAESFRVMREVSLTGIGEADEAEEAKTCEALQKAFGVSIAVKQHT